MTTLIADLEGDGLLPSLTTIWCIGIYDVDAGTYTNYGPDQIDQAVSALRAADTYVFHNGIGYDLPAINKVTGHLLDPAKCIDTLVTGRLLNPERNGGHSLASYGDALGFPKGSHDDWSCYSEEMAAYMRQDVRVTHKLWLSQQEQLAREGWSEQCVQLEHDVAWILQLQHMNGFTLDVDRASKLAEELYAEKAELEAELVDTFKFWTKPGKPFTPKKDNKRLGYLAGSEFTKVTFEEFNPGSRQQIAQELTRRYGWKPREFTDAGTPKVDDEVMKSLKYPEAPLLTRYLRLDKMLGQLAKPPRKSGGGGGWLHHTRENDKVHGSVNTNGAVTGRMTHSSPNVANVDKDPDMRGCWIPRAGWKLVGCDADGLELRMLGHYLAPYDKGAYAEAVVSGSKEAGTDAHSRTQHSAGLYMRDSAKTLIYAKIYGGGLQKLGSIAVADAKAADQPKPKGSLNAIGRDLTQRLEEGVIGLGDLGKAVKAKAKKQGWLKGLDGRRVHVRSLHSCFNTLLQSAGAVLMKQALVIFHTAACEQFGNPAPYNENPMWGYCANVHDEVQIEAAPHVAEDLGKLFAWAITEAGNQLNVRCKQEGTYDIGVNWSETH